MLRGTTTFVCDNCGHKFKDFDFEWNCTVFSTPMQCPKCGSFHTYPYRSSGGIFGWIFGSDFVSGKSIYKNIWKTMDEQHNNIDNE